MVSLKSKESLLLSLLHSHPSSSDPPVQPRREAVYLNVYDLLAEHRLANFFLHYCACRLLGAYHTVRAGNPFVKSPIDLAFRAFKSTRLNTTLAMASVNLGHILMSVD